MWTKCHGTTFYLSSSLNGRSTFYQLTGIPQASATDLDEILTTAGTKPSLFHLNGKICFSPMVGILSAASPDSGNLARMVSASLVIECSVSWWLRTKCERSVVQDFFLWRCEWNKICHCYYYQELRYAFTADPHRQYYTGAPMMEYCFEVVMWACIGVSTRYRHILFTWQGIIYRSFLPCDTMISIYIRTLKFCIYNPIVALRRPHSPPLIIQVFISLPLRLLS